MRAAAPLLAFLVAAAAHRASAASIASDENGEKVFMDMWSEIRKIDQMEFVASQVSGADKVQTPAEKESMEDPQSIDEEEDEESPEVMEAEEPEGAAAELLEETQPVDDESNGSRRKREHHEKEDEKDELMEQLAEEEGTRHLQTRFTRFSSYKPAFIQTSPSTAAVPF
ncbi:uncharacterized protein LOC114785314 isoform X2 [Denticeps clupeoides]|uniref:uncharacterized protein LOC114785314 isoform X2 n=1 Tax=Denticeps clupeoides TaxID=299321 RepID=UPI0010A548E5|nr:uncharacterized protein LOC114785314 isoform X2 [Denticeps clupeoides]